MEFRVSGDEITLLFYFPQQAELSQLEKSEKVGGAQQHKRIVASLQKQVQQQQSKFDGIVAKHASLNTAYEETKQKLQEVGSSFHHIL